MNPLFPSVLTSLISFRGAAQLAHWNVVGRDFYQLHLLFERVYGILDGHVDTLAEQGRGLGMEIPARVFNEVPEVEWSTGFDLVSRLMGLCMKYRSDLELLRDVAEQEKQFGLVNVVEGFLTDSNIIHYLLGSVLES
jgi:DNA-binding ferritin-like protein